MVQSNFKSITVVSDSKNLTDIFLSHSQWQTPTVVHKGWAVLTIRQFYMHKVKYTQENFARWYPPFLRRFLHVLYDKDHYKLALGQVNVARNLIGNISRDYVKLLKYGNSLYRCKCMKVAALGRMTTVIKRINLSLAYLEEIRQHMARLPSIDPTSCTILLCGHPNPYAFTTRSLFVGHRDYEYLRYQMCSIMALVHLQAVVLFFLDISGSCGYSIAEQAALFHSIKSLFINKPLIIVVIAVKNTACQMLLDQRVEKKMKSKKLKECLNRFLVSVVRPCDQKETPPCIPQAFLDGLEEKNGSAGVYSASLTKNYILSLDAWMGDPIPELVDRHNVSDFATSENIESLRKFLQEEGMGREGADDDDVQKLSIEEEKAVAMIKKVKASLIQQHRMKKSTAGNRPRILRKYGKDMQSTSKRMGRQLSAWGLNPSKAISCVRGWSLLMLMDMDMGAPNKMRHLMSRPKSRSISRPLTQVVPADGSFKDSFQKMKAAKLAKKSLKKRNKDARRGEADRVIPSLRPKHLFSGKYSIGNNQRR
ncbi:hypothetical protein Pfo_005550 [Paulownia fortunei]|nr:hypothetical protein Pfo_005550 [Paulownia fortunei]